jgi:hypothetical protein
MKTCCAKREPQGDEVNSNEPLPTVETCIKQEQDEVETVVKQEPEDDEAYGLRAMRRCLLQLRIIA